MSGESSQSYCGLKIAFSFVVWPLLDALDKNESVGIIDFVRLGGNERHCHGKYTGGPWANTLGCVWQYSIALGMSLEMSNGACMVLRNI